jgi:hypothetical protein
MEEARQRTVSWLSLISEKWWAVLTVYVSLLVAAYGAIWWLIEPLSIPDNILLWNNQLLDRRVTHILTSILIASHGSLVLSAISAMRRDQERRDEAHQRELIRSKLIEEKKQLENELTNKIQELENEFLEVQSTNFRSELMRGMDNPSETIEKLQQTRQRIAHLFQQIDDIDTRTNSDVAVVDMQSVDNRSPAFLQILLSLMLTPIFSWLFTLLFAWGFTFLPESIQQVIAYILGGFGILVLGLLVFGLAIITWGWLTDKLER